MNIQIGRDHGHVYAMGHRVSLDHGGLSELKRRCLETLAHLDNPPDTIEFQPLWLVLPAHESGEHRAVSTPAEQAAARAHHGKRRR